MPSTFLHISMRSLVTGGAGFIGSHLTEALLNDGQSVTVLDNLSTGRLENIIHLKKSKKLRLVKTDISSINLNLDSVFRNIDWVFHLAALADIVPSIKYPKEYFKTNVTGTLNVMEAARHNGVKRFIYAASSSCYGIPKSYPTPETEEINPMYPYALTKYLAEQAVLHWGRVYKLPVVSLRLFNVYGPRSRTSGTYGAVIGVFLAQKLARKPLTVVGDGRQCRDFTYVSDVASAFITAAKSKIHNEIFNVGTGKPQSVNHLAKLIGGNVTYIPKRPGEPDKTQADIRKIKKMLGWKPRVGFEEGIKIVLQNIDYWKNAPVWTLGKIKVATREWFEYLK